MRLPYLAAVACGNLKRTAGPPQSRGYWWLARLLAFPLLLLSKPTGSVQIAKHVVPSWLKRLVYLACHSSPGYKCRAKPPDEMLLPQLGAVLATGLVLQAAASPLTHSVQNIPRRFDAQGLTKRVVPDTHVLHERQLPQWIHKWKRGAKVPRDALLPMRIGLKQRNLEEGAKLLRDM